MVVESKNSVNLYKKHCLKILYPVVEQLGGEVSIFHGRDILSPHSFFPDKIEDVENPALNLNMWKGVVTFRNPHPYSMVVEDIVKKYINF